MEIFQQISAFRIWRQAARDQKMTVGLVPTMGALHEGHLSLVRQARQKCAATVVSIFVNPTQFGPREDLSRYPRTVEQDLDLLHRGKVSAVFLPKAAEVYSPGYRTCVTVGELGQRLCGISRPTHFQGVATVVLKLFNIISPDAAFFGQKDAQQAFLIQRMVRDLDLDLEVVVCPIVREADGLAMSSRNRYLNREERRAATVLYQSLEWAREKIESGETSATTLVTGVQTLIQQEPLARLDYAELVETEELTPLRQLNGREALLALAVYFGSTRLIDNLVIPATPLA
jgi:pantoate--beta-alanine ligase